MGGPVIALGIKKPAFREEAGRSKTHSIPRSRVVSVMVHLQRLITSSFAEPGLRTMQMLCSESEYSNRFQ